MSITFQQILNGRCPIGQGSIAKIKGYVHIIKIPTIFIDTPTNGTLSIIKLNVIGIVGTLLNRNYFIHMLIL